MRMTVIIITVKMADTDPLLHPKEEAGVLVAKQPKKCGWQRKLKATYLPQWGPPFQTHATTVIFICFTFKPVPWETLTTESTCGDRLSASKIKINMTVLF